MRHAVLMIIMSIDAAIVLTGCQSDSEKTERRTTVASETNHTGSTTPPAGEGSGGGTGEDGSDGGDTTGDGSGDGSDDGSGSGTGSGSGIGLTGRTGLTWYNFAAGAMNTWCEGCHGSPPSGGAPDTLHLGLYDDQGSLAGAFSSTARIKARVLDNSMPPGGIPDEQVRADIIAWIDEGAAMGVDPSTLTPAITFVSPENASESPASGVYQIELAVANAASDAVFDLYYTPIGGVDNGGTAIVTGQAAASLTVSWNTSVIANGNYWFYAVLKSGDTEVSATSLGYVHVTGSANTAPVVELTDHAGEEFAAGNFVVYAWPKTIHYSVTDADGDALSLKIELSADEGATWTTLTDSIADSSNPASWVWNPGTTPEQARTYRIRICADDGKGGTAVAQTVSNFTIADAFYSYNGNVQSDMTANCGGGGCHPNQGDIGLASYAVMAAEASAFMPLIRNGSMPKNMTADPAFIEMMEIWLLLGMPEN